MRLAILGFTVPECVFNDIARTDPVLPAQTHNFAWALVTSLRSGGVEQIELLSTVPVTSFPRNPRVLWRKHEFSIDDMNGILMPFVNLPIGKHITRFLSCWLYARSRIARTECDWVLVHGVHSPFLWFAAIYRLFGARPRIAAVLTDPPGVPQPGEGALNRFLRRLDVLSVRNALKRFDAVVCVAEQLGTDYAPRSPRLVVEGISPTMCAPRYSGGVPARPLILYAGGLHKEYGVIALLRAVVDSDLDVDLRFFGKGPEAEAIALAARTDQRVHGPDSISREELMEWYSAASALVQPRPINLGFTTYSFPSKLIEYMSAGPIVISTRLPSIPADYEPYLVWADSDDEYGLRRAIHKVVEMDDVMRDQFGSEAARFITNTRSPAAQGSKIVAFLKGI